MHLGSIRLASLKDTQLAKAEAAKAKKSVKVETKKLPDKEKKEI